MVVCNMENSEAENSFQHYSPVKVQESPVKQHKGNLTGSPRVVQDSSADLHNYIQEWNGAHLAGVSVINEICSIKISHLIKPVAIAVYPQGLEELCNQLQDICTKLISVVHNIKIVTHHLQGLMKLNEMKNMFTPVFTTWRIQEFVELSNKIYEMYNKELQIKQYILENIGHAELEENVLLYQTIWVQQPYIENLDLEVEAMLKETNLRQ